MAPRVTPRFALPRHNIRPFRQLGVPRQAYPRRAILRPPNNWQKASRPHLGGHPRAMRKPVVNPTYVSPPAARIAPLPNSVVPHPPAGGIKKYPPSAPFIAGKPGYTPANQG